MKTITSEYNNHINNLNGKLKLIETKLEALEKLKTCCDKQWTEADFLSLLEKHLVLAFKSVSVYISNFDFALKFRRTIF